MNVSERYFKEAFIEHLSKGSLRVISPLVVRALYSSTLRRVAMKEIEKRIIAQMEAVAKPEFLPGVQRDKADMISALLNSAERALEKKLISPSILHRLVNTFLTNVVFSQDREARSAVERFRRMHKGQPPPGFLVISPTKSCNLKCTGCYANSWTGKEHLDWDILNRIVTEAENLWGIRFFTISGGEPLTYRSHGKDLLDFVHQHSDSFFMMYTNGTLINDRTAERMAEAGNLSPAISIEGFAASTDARRGKGVFGKILKAMNILRRVGLPFGVSMTATRKNAEEILSEEFIDFLFEEQGAIYGWIFQYMPIGHSYTLDLMVTPQQRLKMWRRTWQIVRERKIMLADFWNSGTVTNGCIAGGQHGGGGYLYIDWNGKVTPCAFVPYAAANVNELYQNGGTLDDLYELPYFRAIRNWQRDYAAGKAESGKHGNILLPCSIRDHYTVARKLIARYLPEPEDSNAADALEDEAYLKGMVAYDAELKKLFDPIWEREYLEENRKVRQTARQLEAASALMP